MLVLLGQFEATVIVLDEIPRSPAGKPLGRVLVERKRVRSAVPAC